MMEYKLGDLCTMKSGGTPRRGTAEFYGGDIPWIKISDFKNNNSGIVLETEETITQKGLEAINNRLFPKGTLLLAMYGSVGKTAFTGIETSCNQAILGILPKNENVLNLKYLKYWFEENKEKLVNQGRGVTLNNISATIVKKQKINLPDLPTQNKIVALLDKASALVQKREKSIALLDELLKAQFLDLFGDPILNPKGWKIIKLKDLGDWKSGGTPSKAKKEYFEGNIPWLSSGELNDIYIEDTKEHITEEAIKNSNTKRIKIGSLLLGMYDTAALKSSINTKELCCNQAISYAKLDSKKAITEFVYFNIQYNKDYLKSKQRGVRQQNLNLTMVKNFEIFDVPLYKQNIFKKLLDAVLIQKDTLTQSKTELELLYNSLLQEAFKGEIEVSKEEVKKKDSIMSEIKKQDGEKVDITNLDLATYLGIPDEITSTQEKWMFDLISLDEFYQFLLKDNFTKDEAFTLQDIEEKLHNFFYQGGDMDFPNASWQQVIFKFLEAKPPLLEQIFEEETATVKLKLTNETFKA